MDSQVSIPRLPLVVRKPKHKDVASPYSFETF